MTIGHRIRAARLSRGWSQQYVADKARVDQTTVGAIERCENKPLPETLRRISRVLGLDFENLRGEM